MIAPISRNPIQYHEIPYFIRGQRAISVFFSKCQAVVHARNVSFASITRLQNQYESARPINVKKAAAFDIDRWSVALDTSRQVSASLRAFFDQIHTQSHSFPICLVIRFDLTKTVCRNGIDVILWWATEIERFSALARLSRENMLEGNNLAIAIERSTALAQSWYAVQPTAWLRRLACRMRRLHPLVLRQKLVSLGA